MNGEAIFYDFDGVIKESHQIKTEAMHLLFRPFGEDIAHKMVQYHLQHGGVSRIEKIRYAYKNILNKPLIDKQLNNLADKFSQLVYKAVIDCPFVKGAMETIRYFHKKVPQYIITGTPEKEILPIVKTLDIAQYFEKTCGAPTTKKEHIASLIETEQLNNKHIVFIGDASTDYDAATHHKLHFILRTHIENKDLFTNYSGISMHDLTTAITTIEKLLI